MVFYFYASFIKIIDSSSPHLAEGAEDVFAEDAEDVSAPVNLFLLRQFGLKLFRTISELFYANCIYI